MRAAVGATIALLGWVCPHLCVGLIIPGHLKGPPKVRPARERPLELGAPDTAIPYSPPTPTTKVVPSSSYFLTIPTSETKESLSTVPKPTITTPPHVLGKRWETVLSGPFVMEGTITITNPADIVTCSWTDSMSITWGGITFTPGYTLVVPNYGEFMSGIFISPAPCPISGFLELTTTPSTWTEQASSAATTKTNTPITTSASQEIYGYGGGYGGGSGQQRHQKRAEAAIVPNTSGFTSTMATTISGFYDFSFPVPEAYRPHDKRWTSTTPMSIFTVEPRHDQISTSTSTSSKNGGNLASMIGGDPDPIFKAGSTTAKWRRQHQQHSAGTATAAVISTVIVKQDYDPKIHGARAPTEVTTTTAPPTLVIGPTDNVPQTCFVTTIVRFGPEDPGTPTEVIWDECKHGNWLSPSNPPGMKFY